MLATLRVSFGATSLVSEILILNHFFYCLQFKTRFQNSFFK